MTLKKHINAIDKFGLVESKLELYALIIKLACIWVNCPHFQNYDYIIVLIKSICNMIMVEVSKEKLHLFKCLTVYRVYIYLGRYIIFNK